jgi:hypothetical protein
MSILVTRAGAFVHWQGDQVNMQNFYISAINITLNGFFFTNLPPDQPNKHLGVRMTMTFKQRKNMRRTMSEGNGKFFCNDDSLHSEASRLRDDEVLSPSLKELAIEIEVVLIF